MRVGFKHRGLKRFFEKNEPGSIAPVHRQKVADILTALDSAERIEDLNLASFRLHPLTGDRRGSWSITVRANWRITFTFDNGKADNVNYEDYH